LYMQRCILLIANSFGRYEVRVDLYRTLSKAVSRHPQLQHNVRDTCKEQFEKEDQIRP